MTVTEEENQPKGGSMTDKATKAKLLKRLLTILTFILSLPIFASVIWLLYMGDYDCEVVLRLPKLKLGIGIGLIVTFLVSNIVVFFQSRFSMLGLLVVMVPLTVMFTAGLALIGAYNMESRNIPGSPMWLKLKVHDNDNWNYIKACIYDTGACNDLVSRSLTLKSYDFNSKRVSPIEAGCCKPPTTCQMQYVNATFWEKQNVAEDSSYPYDSDCDTWTNDQGTLCYNCNSCKDGFLSTLQGKWWTLGLFLVVMALVLIVSHLLLFLVSMLEQYAI
ncbi:hypothetical protein SO802_000494 [Lithocarpus litseifolius]|uniref:Tetraspanin-15-like n=1 Tax=Lithocarpus litseifolius TaxID=425828 RepID=A0AAW2DRQ8_9ROSI